MKREKTLKTIICKDMIQCVLKISNKKVAAGFDEGVIEIFCLETLASLMKIQGFYKPVWRLDNLWQNTIVFIFQIIFCIYLFSYFHFLN